LEKEQFDYWQNFWDDFWLGIYQNPPVIGISFTISGQTTSISTSEVNVSINPTTLVGLSLDVQSWNPKTNWEVGVAQRHLGAGTYPLEPGINPWAVHVGWGIALPVAYTTVKLAGSSWEGESSGVIEHFRERRNQ